VTQKTTRDKRRQKQRQSAASELRDSANDTKHADAVSGEQNRIRDAKKLHQDGRGGYSHPWRHPRPLGIDPAQQNEGLARQTPKDRKTAHLP